MFCLTQSYASIKLLKLNVQVTMQKPQVGHLKRGIQISLKISNLLLIRFDKQHVIYIKHNDQQYIVLTLHIQSAISWTILKTSRSQVGMYLLIPSTRQSL